MGAREKQPVPSLHVIPDVRDLPIADRRAVFLDGLRALTQTTGIAVGPTCNGKVTNGGVGFLDVAGEDGDVAAFPWDPTAFAWRLASEKW